MFFSSARGASPLGSNLFPADEPQPPEVCCSGHLATVLYVLNPLSYPLVPEEVHVGTSGRVIRNFSTSREDFCYLTRQGPRPIRDGPEGTHSGRYYLMSQEEFRYRLIVEAMIAGERMSTAILMVTNRIW